MAIITGLRPWVLERLARWNARWVLPLPGGPYIYVSLLSLIALLSILGAPLARMAV